VTNSVTIKYGSLGMNISFFIGILIALLFIYDSFFIFLTIYATIVLITAKVMLEIIFLFHNYFTILML
jgi:hypothetical protein